jgi:hypothetical protein
LTTPPAPVPVLGWLTVMPEPKVIWLTAEWSLLIVSSIPCVGLVPISDAAKVSDAAADSTILRRLWRANVSAVFVLSSTVGDRSATMDTPVWAIHDDDVADQTRIWPSTVPGARVAVPLPPLPAGPGWTLHALRALRTND